MSDIPSVYNNPPRKREIIESLKKLESFHLEAADALDKKAWDILSVTSATFGIVAAIQVNLVSDKTSGWFWLGLVFVLILYLLQVREVLDATAPVKWAIVPGGEGGDTRYETLMNKFIASSGEAISEDEYLNQLIADYVGSIDINDPNKIVSGTIQRNEANNQTKARHIKQAAKLLGGIIAALILLSFLATNR